MDIETCNMHVKNGKKAVKVDLDGRSCGCREYGLTGIPCARSIIAIHDKRHNPVNTFLSTIKGNCILQLTFIH